MNNADDFDTSTFQNGRFANDKSVFAKFYTTPVEDHVASAEKGRPMFRDLVFVEIVAAGNANNIIRRRATEEDKQRFARQYAAFQAGAGDELDGTPLTEVPWITRSLVEELAYFKIRTLETLSGVDDNFCTRMPGAYDLRRKAQAALEAAEKAAPFTQLQEENDLLKSNVAALTNQVQELTSALKKLQKG